MMVGTKTTIGRTSSRRGLLLLSKKRKEETRGVVRKTIGVVTRVVAFGGDDDVKGEQEEEEEGQQKLLRAQRRDRRVSSADGPKAFVATERSRGRHRFWLGWIRREELRGTIDHFMRVFFHGHCVPDRERDV